MVLVLRKSGGKVSALIVALLLLFIPRSATPLTPAGTVVTHSFTAKFLNASRASEQLSNQTRVTVKDLTDPLLVPPRKTVTAPGQPADFIHTITNRGNSEDSFKLSASILQGAGLKQAAGATLRFYSADGKTPLPVDAGGAQVIGPIAPGASVDLVLRVIPPSGSESTVDDIVTTASSVQVPTRTSNVTDQMIVPAPGLANPVKSVAPEGAVLPGTLLTYSIAVANPSLTPVTGVTVSDLLSPLLEYQQGSAAFPPELPGSASYAAATRTLAFSIPSVPAGFSGAVTFRARVRADVPGNSSVVNLATVSSLVTSAALSSNSTVTPVLASALRISKSAGSAVAETGDLVPYTVRVENAGETMLNHVTVFDRLPRGFRYLKGSSTLDGVRIADPVGAGDQVTWDVGSLAGGAVRLLSYRCAVTGDAQVGVSVNSAVASGTGTAGGTILSPVVKAGVKIRSSLLGDKAIILGRVFEDRNGNGVPDSGEPGLPGVRIYLEDGSYVFTDAEGQYSFTGVQSGLHVAKIDRATLPPQYLALPYNTAFAGVGWSQFITVPFGGPARGDFALVLKEKAAPAAAPESSATPDPATQQVTAAAAVGSGPATRLRVTPERLDIPADGRTVVPFTVELLTAEGKRAAGSSLVTVALSKGTILEPDQDSALPGHQIRVKDGIGVFRVRSGAAPGRDDIVVTGENGTGGKVDLFFSRELRDWILVGLGSLMVGNQEVSGHIQKIDKEERFEEGIFHDERLAFFTRGQILGKYLLTAAYDSGKQQRDGVFQAIDPERYYPVYGDASDIGYEAQSQGKIYVKIEAGRSYLLAGDYRTDLSENEFSRYDRALNGVKLEFDSEHLNAKGFESLTEENLVKDEVPGNGTSGYYFLSRKPVFENSERIRIEVRDRYHTERLISVSEKLRYADYTIDYNAGTVLFKEPVPSLDQNLNPVTIVINYQSVSGGPQQYVYGGRALLKSATGSYLGGTAVVEQGSLQDNTLYGLDAGIKLGERLSLKGEGAVSDTIERGKGNAYKVELTANPFDAVNLGGYYRRVGRDFYNPSMTGNQYGTEKYGGRLDYRGLADTLIFGESFVQKDDIARTNQFGNQVGVLRKFSLFDGHRFEGEGGFKRIDQDQPGSDGHSDIIYGGLWGPVTPKLDVTLRRDQLLSSSSVHDYQSRTFLKLDYKLTDKTRAFLTEEYQEGSPNLRQATKFGMETVLNERMRLTTGYQLSSGVLGSSEQSSVDLNTRVIDRDGLRIETRSGYQIENALSQERGQAILGLNSRLRVAEGLFELDPGAGGDGGGARRHPHRVHPGRGVPAPKGSEADRALRDPGRFRGDRLPLRRRARLQALQKPHAPGEGHLLGQRPRGRARPAPGRLPRHRLPPPGRQPAAAFDPGPLQGGGEGERAGVGREPQPGSFRRAHLPADQGLVRSGEVRREVLLVRAPRGELPKLYRPHPGRSLLRPRPALGHLALSEAHEPVRHRTARSRERGEPGLPGLPQRDSERRLQLLPPERPRPHRRELPGAGAVFRGEGEVRRGHVRVGGQSVGASRRAGSGCGPGVATGAAAGRGDAGTGPGACQARQAVQAAGHPASSGHLGKAGRALEALGERRALHPADQRRTGAAPLHGGLGEAGLAGRLIQPQKGQAHRPGGVPGQRGASGTGHVVEAGDPERPGEGGAQHRGERGTAAPHRLARRDGRRGAQGG
jgi:uncharacterized repeat protein (TIGR01451 family)